VKLSTGQLPLMPPIPKLPDDLRIGAAGVVTRLWGHDDFSFFEAFQLEKSIGHGHRFEFIVGERLLQGILRSAA